MKKIILISFLVILCAVGGFVYYSFNKPHRNVDSEEALAIGSEDLFKAFDSNEAEANKKYLDKVVQVKGAVGEITKDQKGAPLLILKPEAADFGVNCAFGKDYLEAAGKIKKGDLITVKGICNGGGGLMDVGLNNCEIVE